MRIFFQILFLSFCLNLSAQDVPTFTVKSIAITDVDPVYLGGKFNCEVTYTCNIPVKARLQLWMVFYRDGEYDSIFFTEKLNVFEVKEGEENKKVTTKVEMDFPKKKVYNLKPNKKGELGKHTKFKVKASSKLKKGEEYQLRIFADYKDYKIAIVDETKPEERTNVKKNFIQKRLGYNFFCIPIINKVKNSKK